MTGAVSFRCPTCGERVFHLKVQADKSVQWRPWPIAVACDRCGDTIKGEITSKLTISPKMPKADPSEAGLVIAYSNSLPIPKNLYYKPWPGPGLSSTFLVLSALTGMMAELSAYGDIVMGIEENLGRYRSSLAALYPMLRGDQTNVKAFKNKVAAVMQLKPDEAPDLQTVDDCEHLMHELYKAVLHNLNLSDAWIGPLFRQMHQDMIEKGSSQIVPLVAKCFGNGKRGIKAAMDGLYHQLNQALEALPLLLPAFFLDLLDARGQDLDSELRLVTASLGDIEKLYQDNFNELAKLLTVLMGCYNLALNGDPDKFVDAAGNEVKKNLSDFDRLTDGNKIAAMMQLPPLGAALSEALDYKVRNGIDHRDKEKDDAVQTVKYYYDPSNRAKTMEKRYIRLAHMCLMQLRLMANLSYTMWMLWRIAPSSDGE